MFCRLRLAARRSATGYAIVWQPPHLTYSWPQTPTDSPPPSNRNRSDSREPSSPAVMASTDKMSARFRLLRRDRGETWAWVHINADSVALPVDAWMNTPLRRCLESPYSLTAAHG